MKTLDLRMERQCSNAIVLRNIWKTIRRLPASIILACHRILSISCARQQMRSGGAVVTATLKGDIQSLKRFIGGLHYFVLAESLGGVESMINHSASMSHGSMSKEEREAIGVYDTTLRFSVGIEHIDDLLQDLDIAFASMDITQGNIMHDYGIWTIITPLVTIILAILTRQVILSLLTGIFVGYTVINHSIIQGLAVP
jgi:cystathionine gamma-lyase